MSFTMRYSAFGFVEKYSVYWFLGIHRGDYADDIVAMVFGDLLLGVFIPPFQIFLALFLVGAAIACTLDLLFHGGCILADLGVGLAAIFMKAYRDIRETEDLTKDNLRHLQNRTPEGLIRLIQPLAMILKDFSDSFRPYKYGLKFELTRIALQPIYGLVHIGLGIMRLLTTVFGVVKAILLLLSIIGKPASSRELLGAAGETLVESMIQLINGLLSIARGALQVICTPLSWTIRPLLRSVISEVLPEAECPTIPRNDGIQQRLRRVNDKGFTDGSAELAEKFATCEAIHRKYLKCVARGEEQGSVTSGVEEKAFNNIRSAKDGSAIRNYLSLFKPKKLGQYESKGQETELQRREKAFLVDRPPATSPEFRVRVRVPVPGEPG